MKKFLLMIGICLTLVSCGNKDEITALTNELNELKLENTNLKLIQDQNKEARHTIRFNIPLNTYVSDTSTNNKMYFGREDDYMYYVISTKIDDLEQLTDWYIYSDGVKDHDKVLVLKVKTAK